MSRYVVSAISAYLSLVVAYVNDVDQRVTLFNLQNFVHRHFKIEHIRTRSVFRDILRSGGRVAFQGLVFST